MARLIAATLSIHAVLASLEVNAGEKLIYIYQLCQGLVGFDYETYLARLTTFFHISRVFRNSNNRSSSDKPKRMLRSLSPEA